MLPWLEITLRTLLAVVVLFILTRLLGKRQVSQLSLFEYITGITIGSLAAYISLDIDAEWGLGVLSLAVWVAVSFVIEVVQLKSKKLRSLLDGKATVLIEGGKVLEQNLKKEKITSDELLEMLRLRDIFDVSKVEFAVIETSGELNALLKKEHQPLTPNDMGQSPSSERVPLAVIMDGKVLAEPLRKLGLNDNWLNAKLKQIGTTPERIYLAQVDASNKIYIDPYDDRASVH